MSWDAARLVGALEELILVESVALRAENAVAAAQAGSRASPLIAALAEADRAGEIPGELRGRLRAIAERRQQNQICLAELKARRLPQLERLRATRRRLNGIAPAYGDKKRKTTFAARV